MINNKVLELNIRIILNVLCLKNKLQNSGVHTLRIITLIKNKQFPLIPSFLNFLNDMKLFLSIISFSDKILNLTNLIKHQRSKSQISTSNSPDIHGPESDFDYGWMCAHVIGTPIALGSTDLSSVPDQNGIRWINASEETLEFGTTELSGGMGVRTLFGDELEDKYFNEVSNFLDEYDNQSDKIVIRDFFNIFYKNFLFKYKKELKTNYVSRAFGRILDTYPYNYKLFVLYNYKIKHVIFPPLEYSAYGMKHRRAPIDEDFKHAALFLLKKNNITFSTSDIDLYIYRNIPKKYRI